MAKPKQESASLAVTYLHQAKVECRGIRAGRIKPSDKDLQIIHMYLVEMLANIHAVLPREVCEKLRDREG